MYRLRLARPHHHPYPGRSSVKCSCWNNDGITLLHSFSIKNELVLDNLRLHRWHIQVLPGMEGGSLSSCSVASLPLRPGSAPPERGSRALIAGLQPGEQLPGQDTAPSRHAGTRAGAGTLPGEAGPVRGEGSRCPCSPGSQGASALGLLPAGQSRGPSHIVELLLVWVPQSLRGAT